MITGNRYRVSISPETDFFQGWTDSRLPNVTFLYDQESLDECEFIDGIYYATYQTWIVEEERRMTYTDSSGEIKTIKIDAGEYGNLNE